MQVYGGGAGGGAGGGVGNGAGSGVGGMGVSGGGGAGGSSDVQTVKRTLMVHIHDSLSNLAMAGPLAGMWKPESGMETSVFSPNLGSEVDPSGCVNSLRSAVIRSITVKEHWSTFPCPIGVTMTGVPGSEVTNLGQNYVYTVPPMSRMSSAQEVYRNHTSLGENSVWRTQYSKWNKANLESQGVTRFPANSYVYVHMSHPAIGVLRYNEKDLKTSVDALERFEGDWLKVETKTFDACCHALRVNVLDKLVTQDLNLFGVQIHRLDTSGWDEYGDGSISMHGLKTDPLWTEAQAKMAQEAHLKEFVHAQRNYIARIEMEYEVPKSACAA